MKYVVCRLAVNPASGSLVAAYPTYALVAGPFGAQNIALLAIPDEDFQREDGSPIAQTTLALSAWLAARGALQAQIDAAVARLGDPQVTVAVDAVTLSAVQTRVNRRYREKAGGYTLDIG